MTGELDRSRGNTAERVAVERRGRGEQD